MAASNAIFIKCGKFNSNNLSIKDAETTKSKKGNETCISKLLYKDESGRESDQIYVELPEQTTYGISKNYPFGLEEKKHSDDTVDGLQITYPLTSLETVNKPTSTEKYVIDMFSFLGDLVWEKLEEECQKDEDDRVIPAVSYNSWLGAKDKNGKVNKSYAVKPIYDHPNVPIPKGEKAPKKREKDFTKPKRCYIKLMTFGKGRELICRTKIYGPGNRIVSPYKYVGVLGTVHPVIKLNKVFWGAHGKNTHGCSLNITISEMNFTPINKGEGLRFLSANTAPVEEEVDENDTFFPHPTKEVENNVHEEDFVEESGNLLGDLENSEEEEVQQQQQKRKEKKISTKRSKKSGKE